MVPTLFVVSLDMYLLWLKHLLYLALICFIVSDSSNYSRKTKLIWFENFQTKENMKHK